MDIRNPEDITILVVDDEVDVVEVLSFFLEKEGYTVLTAYDGLEALEQGKSCPDLILLDIMIPLLDGFGVCAALRSRAETEKIPIIFFSAKIEDKDRVHGLMLGGDDYLTKPVAPQVIVAHVNALLRRNGLAKSSVIEADGLRIFVDEFRAELNGVDLELTLTEFNLLKFLVDHPRNTFKRQQLLDIIWRDSMMVTERTVDAHVKNLREKLGDPFKRQVETVRGVGYRFTYSADSTEEA
ncbi:MAG: response regulator transcription factor [Bacteroidota bacterium]|nr:response regulator transcription factor [Bacteroidota bacterium]MDE2834038.1 response regulator transcription factor [Bacteroidota bacterium]MDE2957491.1 response regulator transcription factor [Bacteroidota bacterium]